MSDKEIQEEGGSGGALEDLSIAQLRKYASLYRLPYAKDATKKDLLAMINARLKNKQILTVVDESKEPAPGRSRIVIQKDPTIGPKAGSRPVPVFVNGYRCDIPRGVPCDVPHKVVKVLANSKHPQVTEDPDRPGKSTYENLPSYPFQVLASTPGPDPQPGFERIKEAAYRPRERFFQLFDYWPTKAALRDAIKTKLITLKGHEFVEGGITEDSGD